MKTNILKCMIMLAVLLTIPLATFSQQFSTGGYQGGTHGNIQVVTWSGELNDDWSEPGNWCPAAVPGADKAVVIPSSATVMPEVKTNGLSCKSLKLEPGATVTIKPGFVLTVNGQEVE